MAALNYKLNLNPRKHKSPFQYIKSELRILVTDFVFWGIGLSLLLKSVLFLGLVNNDGVSFNMLKAFASFGYRPPLVIYGAFIAALLSFGFLLKGRARYWFLTGGDLVLSLVLVADLVCFRVYGVFLSPSMIGLTQAAKPGSSVFTAMHPVDLLFIGDGLLLALAGLRFKKAYLTAARSIPIFLLLLAGSVAYIDFEHYQLDIKGTDNSNARLFSTCWVANQTLSNLSPIGYHIFDLYNCFVSNRPLKLTAAQNNEISQWLVQNQENLPPNQYYGMFAGQNVILIQVESLENFVLGQKINGQEITPNLNKLLQNSFYLPNFYAPVYNGTSADADLMANTSVYPLRQGITFFRYPGNTYNSLPKLLEAKGYSTLVAHADPPNHYNWIPALNAIGFQTIMDANSFQHDEDIYLGLSDGSLFKQVVPVMQRQEAPKKPFYDYVVTMTSHGPFDLPQANRTLSLDSSLDATKLGGYFQSIHYTDAQIGSFLQALDQNGILDNTMVVIYGDHAGVHKYYNDEVKQIQPQQSWWLDDSERIPLIIYHKGMTGRKITTTGSEIDILPTVASLLGVDVNAYADTAMGRNLLNTKKDFAVLADRTYVGAPLADKAQEEQVIKGVDIADLIIRSNYFKTHPAK